VLDPEKEAYELNVQDKFHVERACAQNAQVFTTVSEITAIEAEKILGRKADVLVLNGLDVEKFPTTEETSIKHVTCREKIREHLTYHFFPHYTFDLTHNLIFFVFGRYEFKNKGLDILIKALAILNTRLKTEKRNRTIAVFFWIPQQTHSVKIELLENKNYYRHIKNFVEWNSPHILKRIVEDFVSQRDLSSETLFSKEFLIELKKDILKFKRQGNPLILTHEINNENNDPIITALKAEGLDNKEEDKVKAILYPVYLTGNDSLINLSYYDAMAGGHLGIFPSYYEPWGYTPLETSAIGVPAITTDLAGFGRFIEKERGNVEGGIFVLKRYQQKEDLIVADLADIMYKFAMLSHNDRVRNKIMAKNLSNLADWQGLIKNYVLAHNLALKR